MRPHEFVIVGFTAVSLALLGSCDRRSMSAVASGHAADSPPAVTSPAARNSIALPNFSTLVENYGAAVVNISVVQKSHASEAAAPFQGIPDDDPFYRFFFRRFGSPGPNAEPPLQRGQGSGFVVSADGYILTNAHVVGDADRVTVKLTDRREFPAKVVGADRRSDVAVIKIEAKALPTVKLGQASSLKPGQWVVAIGAPFGFENSVTAGIVSSTARTLGPESYIPFIQTDVPVNPGNSGGPLFNLDGEVVGINSQIYTRSGGFMGLSFSIPIDYAKVVEEQLIKTGHVQRGRIGVTIQDVDAQLAESFGLDRPRGALVNSVEKGGPGEKGGIRPGDIILRVNDKPVEREFELPVLVANLVPGQGANVVVWRARQEHSLKVRIGEYQDEAVKTALSGSSDDSGRLGLRVRPLSEAEIRESGTSGKLVVVDASGAAAESGVRAGDIVLAVNGQAVGSSDQLRTAVKKAGENTTVALLIQRGETQIFVPIRVAS